ncbi:heparinase II/III family protein [Notoacmeibacter sp. MSK16QG-6]|uniref:heparinase II/III family protein n=1 Tax=Notoacmeibacter sp. MSK16QG-6 TaxID=2957982 RepID=UPI00209CAF7A|nr:heparinase II/III family protein [Notoacmeibacter sp. MSK16QG-6]MCP1199287.1 heparinase II/III family protein [Notoacmeibacter sp. MSK16QG-6]
MAISGNFGSLLHLFADAAGRQLTSPLRTGRLARIRALRPVSNPPAILFSPVRLVKGDAVKARDYYSGEWQLAGHTIAVGADGPFDQPDVPDAWQRQLERFGWLADFQAANSDLAAAQSRLLVETYLSRPLFMTRNGRNVGIAAERVLQWLRSAPLLFRGADSRFASVLGRGFVRHGRWLRRAISPAPEPFDRLRGRAALLALALCLSDGKRRLEKAQKNFISELNAQMLADGGHVSRDPSALPAVLDDLLLLRQAYGNLGRAPPQAINEAIERLFVLLRFFDMGDGRLARFNGGGWVDPAWIRALLAEDDVEGQPAGLAAASHYLRLSAGGSVLLADVGGPPPLNFAGHAHAGALSFEFSVDGDPLIVNCGAARDPESTVFGLSRVTAAHSTLTVGDRSSAQFAQAGRLLEWVGRPLIGPIHVTVERKGAYAAAMRHDGYAEPFGVLHERSLVLANDGRSLGGIDRLLPSSQKPSIEIGAPVTLRFHLHPAVNAWQDRDGSITLAVNGGCRWRFVVDGQEAALTDSLYLGRSGGPVATRQIEIAIADAAAPLTIEWGLVYEG